MYVCKTISIIFLMTDCIKHNNLFSITCLLDEQSKSILLSKFLTESNFKTSFK